MAAADAAPAGQASGRARLFFALWPPEDTAGHLHRQAVSLQDGLGGRVMRRETLHLTLSFLGDLPRERISELLELGAGIRFSPFSLRIDTPGHWARQRLVWAGPGDRVQALDDLAADLQSALVASGFELEHRQFRAHVSLLRNVNDAGALRSAATFEAVDWKVADFVLVESRRLPEGARYEVLGRWPD